VSERGHLRASLGRRRAILQGATQGFKLGSQGVLVPVLRRPWPSPGPDYNRTPRSLAGAEGFSGLGKFAFASLWLLVFTIPWEDAITISGFGTSARLIGMVTVGLGVLAIIERGTVRRPAAGHLILILFVTLAALSYLWSLYPEGTLVQIFSYIQLLAMVWLIWELSSRAREQTRLMQAYVFGTFVSGIDTIYLFLSHQESVYQRYAGARLDANDLGLMMALSIPVSYYLLIQTKGPMVWIYRLQLVLAGTTILLTASRGAALACIVALTIVPLTHAGLTARQKFAVLLTVSLLVCGALVFAPSTSWERLSTMPNEFTQGTLTGRTVIWTAGWELFRVHPILGVGANAFRAAVSGVLGIPINSDDPTVTPVAHNTFLSVLAEEGVIGFTLFCALLCVLALSLRALPPFQQKLWIVCLGVWVIGVSSLTWETRKPTWFFFGLLIAQCGSMVQKRTTQSHSPDLAEAQLPNLRASRQ
jgi:O-antigen ligase